VLLLAAMFSSSMYFTFRDSFTETADDEPPQEQPQPPAGGDFR
jgi:hypothetical protein